MSSVNKKISIVMAYYNRKPQIISTLHSIQKSEYENIEVVIVDDCSDDAHNLKDSIDSFNFEIKYIEILKKDRTWTNPCVPYNMGFDECEGDIVIIQNPECVHCGDIITYASEKVTQANYVAFSCYSLAPDKSRQLLSKNICQNSPDLDSMVKSLSQEICPIVATGGGRNHLSMWYNHPEYRNLCYHFTTAISKDNLKDINGFDERFKNGFGYDDDELLIRIRRKGLIVESIHPDEGIFSIHLWHGDETKNPMNKRKRAKLYQINKNMLDRVRKESTWRAQ